MTAYAYSFDQETFEGRFPTREAALAAAGQALRRREDIPEGIFVGQWATPDAQTDGHADAVLAAMRDRFRGATGDTGYLDAVTEQEAASLDTALSQTLAEWLKQTGKLPQASRVVAVSHYPVPNIKHVPQPAGERETSLIGES